MTKTNKRHTAPTNKRTKRTQATKKSTTMKRKIHKESIRKQKKSVPEEEDNKGPRLENKNKTGDTQNSQPISPHKKVNKRPTPLVIYVTKPIPNKDDEPEGTPLLEKFSQTSLDEELDEQKKELEDDIDEQQHGKARKKDSHRSTQPKPSAPAKQPRAGARNIEI